MTDRVTGAVLVALALIYGLHAGSFHPLMASDYLGPSAWPLVLAALLGAFGLYFMFRPEPTESWPPRAVFFREIALIALLVAYSLILEQIGFLAATLLGVWGLGILLGGKWWQAGLSGAITSLTLFIVFNSLLGLPLPIGAIFGGH